VSAVRWTVNITHAYDADLALTLTGPPARQSRSPRTAEFGRKFHQYRVH